MKFNVRGSDIMKWFVRGDNSFVCVMLGMLVVLPATILGCTFESAILGWGVGLGVTFSVPLAGIAEFVVKNVFGAISDACTGVKSLCSARSSDRSLERVIRGQFDRGQIEKISADGLNPESASKEFFADQLGRALGSEDSVNVVKSLNVGNETLVLVRYRFERHVTGGAGAVKDDVRVVFVLLRLTLRPESGIVETEFLTSFTEQAARVGIDTMWHTSLRTIGEIREALGGGPVEASTPQSPHTQGQLAQPSASQQIGRICVAG